MALEVLLAIDGSERSMRAVRHVRRLLDEGCQMEITFFHVCGIPNELLEHEGSESSDREEQLSRELKKRRLSWIESMKHTVDREVFEPARKVLQDGREMEDRPRVVYKPVFEPHARVASAILWEANKTNYDVVVLGRHGRSNLKEFFLGSVSSRVIHHLRDRTVWIAE